MKSILLAAIILISFVNLTVAQQTFDCGIIQQIHLSAVAFNMNPKCGININFAL